MGAQPPSPEQLIDLAWLLDSALLRRDRNRAVEVADRLLQALLHHDEVMLTRRRQLDPATAAALQDACLALSGDVVALLMELRHGPVREPITFRYRVEQLVDDETMAFGSAASSHGG